eukprot:CAMPEP_0181258114 /NCGR_PEP_ID=MMETSP1096-20121128/50608_1 /TAXON_ID=156174 ORGANISM="Chrysochromulina ericina, Strain CCMP281" /NCGR_SAMPLE_ID=MMETSP1096 /ASSEMBLY_ACC=CAM_ASM_000453 /LENGTH=91 /DNA_ID=CAMNT_0023356483 /DNA_START=348 /DNA_END=624 /DNA_ORIENTATION=+
MATSSASGLDASPASSAASHSEEREEGGSLVLQPAAGDTTAPPEAKLRAPSTGRGAASAGSSQDGRSRQLVAKMGGRASWWPRWEVASAGG